MKTSPTAMPGGIAIMSCSRSMQTSPMTVRHRTTAGDLLPFADDAQQREQIVATGFLAIGPKVLAEVDELKMQMTSSTSRLKPSAGRSWA